ncbi:MAG: Cyclic nucleotide-binding domain [Pseudomonadota bacterium]
MREVHFKANETIFHKGDAAEHFYIIAQGKVEVFDPDTSYSVAVIPAGSTFGEQSALGYGARNLSARALEDTQCIAHPAAILRDLIAHESGTVTRGLEMLLLQLEMLNHLHAQGSDIQP